MDRTSWKDARARELARTGIKEKVSLRAAACGLHRAAKSIHKFCEYVMKIQLLPCARVIRFFCSFSHITCVTNMNVYNSGKVLDVLFLMFLNAQTKHSRTHTGASSKNIKQRPQYNIGNRKKPCLSMYNVRYYCCTISVLQMTATRGGDDNLLLRCASRIRNEFTDEMWLIPS